MIPLSHYAGKNVGVFGLGKAGQAAVTSLLAGGAAVWAWDDRNISLTSQERLSLAHYADWPWMEMEALVLSPGVPLTHPEPHPVVEAARSVQCPVPGEVELLCQACPQATYIGVTGTNGKSTTTALIGHILQETGHHVQVGGNLGIPALALEPLGKDGIYVLEMSSYQLDLIDQTRFHIACWLNLTPDHLDRHGTIAGYKRAKMRIFAQQRQGDTAIIGLDDPDSKAVVQELTARNQARVIAVSVTGEASNGIEVNAGILEDHTHPENISLNLQHCRNLRGSHNGQNAAVAYAVARCVDIRPEQIQAACESFTGLAHRMEWIGEYDGITYVNDSKATNAEATAKALASYGPDENLYWIAGGRAKAGGIRPLEAYFPHIRHAFLIGEAETLFADTLEGRLAYSRCGTLEEAVRQASAMAQSPSVILLSPAAASFDQWESFEARGNAFRSYVQDRQALHPAQQQEAVP